MIPEKIAKPILQAAIDEGKAGEFMTIVLTGGSAAVDDAGKLVLYPASVVDLVAKDLFS